MGSPARRVRVKWLEAEPRVVRGSACCAIHLVAGCGALSFATGLILDTVAKSHRRQWEIDVYKAMDGFYRGR